MTTEVQEPGSPAPAPPGRRRPSVVTVVGVVLLVAGLACVGWVGFQLVGTDMVAHHSYDRESSGLRSQWAAGPTAAGPTTSDDTTGRAARRVPGSALALLRVPRFGADYEVPVVAGTDLSDLSRGVGHYDTTADPGQVGNFALAGHRITHGQPFVHK